MSSLNIEFQPIIADRTYAPTRTFITKWDIEIDNNRAKKIARTRDRDTKYFDYYDENYETLPAAIQAQGEEHDEVESVESSDDGEGEETRQGWLRSVEAENAYYDRKYGELNGNFDWYDMNQAELDADQATPCNKRGLDFEEQSLFKRVRA